MFQVFPVDDYVQLYFNIYGHLLHNRTCNLHENLLAYYDILPSKDSNTCTCREAVDNDKDSSLAEDPSGR